MVLDGGVTGCTGGWTAGGRPRSAELTSSNRTSWFCMFTRHEPLARPDDHVAVQANTRLFW